MYSSSSCKNCVRSFVLLVKSSLRAADSAADQSLRTRSLLQPDGPFPRGFSVSSAGDDAEVDASQDSMSDFPIAREAESLETIFANFDGDSLDEEKEGEAQSEPAVDARPVRIARFL